MQKNIFKFISVLNAAIKRNQIEVKTQASKITVLLLYFLKDNGYINGFYEEKNYIVILLKYFQKRPVLKQIIPVSKPGRRVYTSVFGLNKLNRKLSANHHNRKLSFTIPVIFKNGFFYHPDHALRFSQGGELLCLIAI
jgi:ribosomal protein S8